MKIILVVLSLCTVLSAHAENDSWFTVQSQSCESGETIKAIQETAQRRYQISEDLAQLTIEITDGDQVQTQKFVLTMVGKDSYIAMPSELSTDAGVVDVSESYFFVEAEAKSSEFTIYSSQTAAGRCESGGLLVTQVMKPLASPEVVMVAQVTAQ